MWEQVLTWMCSNGYYCGGGGSTDGGAGNSVPELSAEVGLLAIAIILALIAIGIERRRKNQSAS